MKKKIVIGYRSWWWIKIHYPSLAKLLLFELSEEELKEIQNL